MDGAQLSNAATTTPTAPSAERPWSRTTRMVAIPTKAWRSYRARGWNYTWHKVLRRGLARWPDWKRSLVYADARVYWTLRGGDEYFAEQEGQPARSARARWLAGRIARYQPQSILEIGCGYGKQLRQLRAQLPHARLVGLDFSPTQLQQGRRYLSDHPSISILQADGQSLPFPDDSFDLVLTSAVILHNPPPLAERIRREAIRVARRFVAHNEDTNISYNRYGYDTAAWYRAQGIALAEAGPIPIDPQEDPLVPWSQFCVARIATCSQ